MRLFTDNAPNHQELLNEEQVYSAVAKEVAEGQRSVGLYAKALSQAEGDVKKADASYLKLRAEMLKAIQAGTECHEQQAEEEFYYIAAKEAMEGRRSAGLYTKALSEANGDVDRADAAYLRLRVEMLLAKQGNDDYEERVAQERKFIEASGIGRHKSIVDRVADYLAGPPPKLFDSTIDAKNQLIPPMRGLQWSSTIYYGSLVSIIATGSSKVDVDGATSALLVLLLFAGWLCFGFFISRLANRLGRNPSSWQLAYLAANLFGPAITYWAMKRLVNQAIDQLA